jgi:hypothetical protein
MALIDKVKQQNLQDILVQQRLKQELHVWPSGKCVIYANRVCWYSLYRWLGLAG